MLLEIVEFKLPQGMEKNGEVFRLKIYFHPVISSVLLLIVQAPAVCVD